MLILRMRAMGPDLILLQISPHCVFFDFRSFRETKSLRRMIVRRIDIALVVSLLSVEMNQSHNA